MTQKRFIRRRCLPILLLSTMLCFGQSIYFPNRILNEDAQADKSQREWYSKFLTALHEPSFWQSSKTQKVQSYRFLWLRSFHHPISVRLDAQPDGTALLTTKITSGQGGYEPGHIIEDRKQKLTKQQTDWFLDRIEELKFWTLPTSPPKDPNVVTVDGAQWVLEGIKDGHYHVVDRWSPDKSEVHTLGIIMLIDLAKLKLLYEEVY
jgi:hypothetical protein